MASVVTSPATTEYNCIAWAAGETDRFWWPDLMGVAYWPEGVPRQESLEAFVQAYRTLGYEPCDSAAVEFGVEKIAVYVDDLREPKHAARQLPSGKWTSKLGRGEDIEHDALHGDYPPSCSYGHVAAILSRTRPTVED